jgi:hypothetical protein
MKKMDVLYVGGLAIFAVLTFALIAGCDRLARIKQVSSHGVQVPQGMAAQPAGSAASVKTMQGDRS